LSSIFFEISGKVQKSLMTHLPAGRQGLGIDYTDGKWLSEQKLQEQNGVDKSIGSLQYGGKYSKTENSSSPIRGRGLR
jgi:hypothetical protein